VKAPVQEVADDILAPEFRQPVKTLGEALDVLGWEHIDKPICCGSEVTIRSLLGSAYFAQCRTCKKFVLDVTGPKFEGGSVRFMDGDKVDLETDRRWIAGVEPKNCPAS